MSCTVVLVGLSLLVQVPPPPLGATTARDLEAARRSIVVNEAAQLSGLAEQLAGAGDPKAAQLVRERIPRPVERDGPTRIMPLAEVVQARAGEKGGEPWRARLKEIEARSSTELFNLAQRAAKSDPPSFALASQCLRAVLERQPDHREARRLLGYVPHDGGWARPFAVNKLRNGFVSHPIFGWVLSDWVPHLDRGELPAPPGKGQNKTRWLSAADANGLRANWSPPWYINTEHFEIQTNVTLAEAISFGRRLEAFHDVFMALLADILGENLPLVRRFKSPSMNGEPEYKPHSVFYFGSKDEYVDYLTPRKGPDIAQSLGFYDPPKSGANKRLRAYFFRDPNGQLPMTATLYHEVSHQLLFETAGSNGYTKNVGNYWVFEGLGTYFETISPQPDGSIEVGGQVSRRMEEAIRSLVDRGRMIPLAEFVDLDQASFNRQDEIYLHYQQAMALTVFLMQWQQGTYRDAFLDYVRDAYRGWIKHGPGRSLQERLSQPYTVIDSQLRAFLRNGEDQHRQGEAAVAQPLPSGGTIRTVPRQ
jgi:Protein of unknown function (DUF1570)